MSAETKKKWKLSLSLSKFLQARINVILFRILPFGISRIYMALLGKIYYSIKQKEKELIDGTIRHIFEDEMSEESLQAVIAKTYSGIIDHYHEKMYNGYSRFSRLIKFFKERITLEGEEEFQACLDQGKGIILVTGHYGGVECLPGALTVRNYPITMIMRFQTPQLKETLVKRAEFLGVHLVDADEGNVFLIAINALKEGRILITECDEFEDWRPAKKGKLFPFLNQSLGGDRTLDILRQRSGAAVATALVHRHGRKKYTLELTHLFTDTSDTDSAGQASLKVLEAAIQKSPYQWYQWKSFGKFLGLDSESGNEKDEVNVPPYTA